MRAENAAIDNVVARSDGAGAGSQLSWLQGATCSRLRRLMTFVRILRGD